MNQQAIQLRHISKTYRKHQVLQDVTVSFAEGQIHGMIGRNGSGKTQLFKIIAGYVTPDQGEVEVFGERIGRDVSHPSSIGVLIETPGFLPSISGLFNLQMLAAMNTRLRVQDLMAILELVGLKDAAHRKVGQYSLGMRQRLGIAQAMMGSPRLLILDEPFNGLDDAGVHEIRALLQRLRARGTTILLSSHHAEDIAVLCDTVHRMEAGRIHALDAHEQ